MRVSTGSRSTWSRGRSTRWRRATTSCVRLRRDDRGARAVRQHGLRPGAVALPDDEPRPGVAGRCREIIDGLARAAAILGADTVLVMPGSVDNRILAPQPEIVPYARGLPRTRWRLCASWRARLASSTACTWRPKTARASSWSARWSSRTSSMKSTAPGSKLLRYRQRAVVRLPGALDRYSRCADQGRCT